MLDGLIANSSRYLIPQTLLKVLFCPAKILLASGLYLLEADATGCLCCQSWYRALDQSQESLVADPRNKIYNTINNFMASIMCMRRLRPIGFAVATVGPALSDDHRKLIKAKPKKGSPIVDEALVRVAALYKVQDSIRGSYPDHRRAIRQNLVRPLVNEFFT